MAILATSREGVGVADEQLWPVPSLDIDAAVDLFTQCAQRVAPGFSVDDARTVAEMCHRLDGIPLGIELAASRMASMAVAEIRDRLDDRFKLLVGSRRSVERHQTLRHAVAWSYELLDDAEKVLLERCSVFAGGFDLESACAVAGFEEPDEYAVLGLLDALVRKSLLIAGRSTGRTRFSMLETIREFAEEKLVAHGEEPRSVPPTLATSPRVKPTSSRSGTAPANTTPTNGSPPSWRICERRSDGPQIRATSTPPPPSRSRGVRRLFVENYEPISWAEELIEPARAVDHPRLAGLYVMASQCYMTGRVEAAVRYSEAARWCSRAVAATCRTARRLLYSAYLTQPSLNGGSNGVAPG